MVYSAKLQDELLECFDEEGNRMHPRYRSEICTDGTRKWHAVADVWVVNSDGMLLCTQRSPGVINNPNKWQTREGGHVGVGKTFLETAVRELYEELGLRAKTEELYLIEKGKTESRMHIYERYVFLFDGSIKDLRFLDKEIIDAKWYEFENLDKTLKESSEKWCSEITSENYLKISEWLKSKNKANL